ncbi:PucR family transcriptional regulator ligand-binding domain-containing protein [Gordonia sp. CPCC 206044]|uniref:helix-turn-helix domain-containing protein n=1 Tax=Gordonia sp. CPCC 206044 TaxID=3140793 RepID=UPI003AF333D4
MTIAGSTPTLRHIVDHHLRAADPHVLTAHDRLDVPVGWVHSSEIFEIGPLLSGGELLLTTGLGLAGVDAGTRRHYVRDLAERDVVGLAFETGRTFDAIPDEIVREGSTSRLPIIELRRVMPFIEVCRTANTDIVSGELGDLRRRRSLVDALHADLAAATGVAGMLAHVSEAIGAPTVLIASGGALLAAHGVNDDRSAWQVVDTATVSVPVHVRGREIARMIAGPSACTGSSAVADLLSIAAAPVGAALTRSGTRGSTAGAHLMEDILAGRVIRRADLLARLSSAGLTVTGAARLVTVAAEAPDPRMAEAAVERAGAAAGGVVQATVDATVYALVSAQSGHAGDDVIEQIASMLDAPAGQTGRVTAVVGQAVPVDEMPSGVELSALMARALSGNAEKLGIAAELLRTGASARRVFTGRQLAAESAMRTAPAATIAELTAVIEPLLRHDRIQRTRLTHTLEVHLRHGCSATRSAHVLHLGRQSLYQRLERIRAILGFDPSEPAMHTSILLAITASRGQV